MNAQAFDPLCGARLVLQLRYWQLLLNERLKQGRYQVPVHAAIGHEAVAAAVHMAMGPADRLVLTHRNMAFQLARAGAWEPVELEYLLSTAGLSGGRLGSMNLANPGRGIVYTSSILGNNLPVACGLALSHKLSARAARVFVLTGDGAIEEGAFWEALVFARSHALDIVFAVENNDHSLASRIAERRSPIDLAQVCSGAGIPFERLEGNDAAQYAGALAGGPAGPCCREFMVTTFSNHAGATPGWAADPRHISLSGGLVLERSLRDPAWVAGQLLDTEELEATSQFLAALGAKLLATEAPALCPLI